MPQTARLILLSLLAIGTVSIPSFDHSGLENELRSLGSMQEPTIGDLVVRGVYGGRKKRYIIERDEDRKCCRDKLCLSVMGEILDKDCKCKKCPAGVPALDRKSCQDQCPAGEEKNDKGGCCPTGQKPKPTGDGCEDDPDKDKDRQRKGKCPGDTVLDPKQGPQDPNYDKPTCAIDDEKNCKKPKVPETRPEGRENDPSLEVLCGQPDPNKRAKCDAKTQYVDVSVNPDGEAVETCMQTRRYKEKKKGKPRELMDKFKEKWNRDEPERKKKEEEKKQKVKELQEKKDKLLKEKEEGQKITDEKDRKKARMGKCAPVAALMIGVAQNLNLKRDDEHPYDWTSDYFDEGFIDSDERLADWPQDINVNDIKYVTDVGVDSDAWMDQWEQVVSKNDLENNWQSCSNFKRGLHSRCQKRSLDDFDEDLEFVSEGNYTEALSLPPRRVESTSASNTTALSIIYDDGLQKRNPFLMFAEILAFALRLGMSLLSRTATSIARYAPRLANIAKNTERLFKIAPRGQGGARNGVEGMKNAFSRIAKDPNFRKCILDGIP